MLTRRDFLRASLVGPSLSFLPASSPALSPWIENLCRGRGSVSWRSDFSGEGFVEYAAGSGPSSYALASVREFLPAKTRLPYPFYLYRADLDNLKPSTEYRYRVFLDGSLVTAEEGIKFRTGGASSFDFLAMGDCGLGTNEQLYVAQRMLAENAALLLITGDLVYMSGSYAEYESRFFPYYLEMMSRVPLFPTPGNHDVITDNLGPYLAYHALPVEGVPSGDQGRYYSFDWGNIHFISLDSNSPYLDTAGARGRMLDWLVQDLEKSNSFWRVVYFHHPPYTWGIYPNDRTVLLAREYLVPILDRYKVDLVLCGHDHNYQRSKPLRGGKIVDPSQGTVYVITGGGGGNLYPLFQDEGLANGASAYHFVRAENREARMTVRAIRFDGMEIDTFTLAPPPSICSSYLSPPEPGRILEWDRPVVAIYGRHLASDSSRATSLPLPRTLSGTRVTYYSRPLPLLSVSDTKIEVQLPHLRSWARLRVETPNGSAETDVVFSEPPTGSICN